VRRVLEQVAVGDRAAFQIFYARYAARVMAVIRRRVSQVAIAEEVLQDVFVAVWLDAPRYRRDLGEPASWLFGITRHKIADYARRMRRFAAALETSLGPVVPDGRTSDLEQRVRLEQAVAELTVDQRRVVDLIYQTGLTFTEAAHVLKIPIGTVKSRVHAALKTMRVALKDSTRS